MNKEPTPIRWFDGHLDLAFLALAGRNLLAPIEKIGNDPYAPASITLPSLAEGKVDRVLATIFTEAGGEGPWAYSEGNVDEAQAAGLRQLDLYRRWQSDGHVQPLGNSGPARRSTALEIGILIECADPIRRPEDLPWWKERGVVAIGLSWWKSSRYAGGNGTTDGLTDAGRDLLQAMISLEVIPDLSHLSERGADEILSSTDGPIMASHSNCRSLLDGKTERHLPDSAIAEIGRRGGMIGINLLTPFLVHDPSHGSPPFSPDLSRAPLSAVIRHIEQICEIQGHRRGVGLGTDADGGVSARLLPKGIDCPRDYVKILEALRGRGWSDDDLAGFASGNWERFWGL